MPHSRDYQRAAARTVTLSRAAYRRLEPVDPAPARRRTRLGRTVLWLAHWVGDPLFSFSTFIETICPR